MRSQRGYTLLELLLIIISLGCIGLGLTLAYWIIRALMKFAA